MENLQPQQVLMLPNLQKPILGIAPIKDPAGYTFLKREPNETCNGKIHRQYRYCTLPAGWGTDHVGTGRCKLHGGCCTGPKSGKLRYSDYAPSTLVEKYEEYALESDAEIKSLNDEIALLRAKVTAYEERNNDGDKDKIVVGLIDTIRRLIETKQRVEEGFKTKVTIEVVCKVVDSIIEIIDKQPISLDVKRQIAGEMRRLNLSELGLRNEN